MRPAFLIDQRLDHQLATARTHKIWHYYRLELDALEALKNISRAVWSELVEQR